MGAPLNGGPTSLSLQGTESEDRPMSKATENHGSLSINKRTLADLSNPLTSRDQIEFTPLTCAHGCNTCRNCNCY
jgi:hypothetical protein